MEDDVRRMRIPAELRIHFKEWLCEFMIIGTMVIEKDPKVRARERIWTVSQRRWLLQYERRLINLRMVGNAYGEYTP